LLRFLLLLQVTAGAGRRGEETDLGRPVVRPFSQRRVNPRATVLAVAEGLPCNFWIFRDCFCNFLDYVIVILL
jgi:hypothetical protein